MLTERRLPGYTRDMTLTALIVIIAIQVLGLFGVIYAIGKPRKPMTPGTGAVAVTLGAIEVVAAVILYHS
jgi:hypothetical protein